VIFLKHFAVGECDFHAVRESCYLFRVYESAMKNPSPQAKLVNVIYVRTCAFGSPSVSQSVLFRRIC